MKNKNTTHFRPKTKNKTKKFKRRTFSYVTHNFI